MATEKKGGVDVRAQSGKAQLAQQKAQGAHTIFEVGLDGSPFGPNPDAGYTRVGDVSVRTPKINAASLKVMQNEAESKARHEVWKQHDRERAERVAKGKEVLSEMVASINKGIQAEDAKKHPLKAVHWNAKAGKGHGLVMADVAEVKNEKGEVVTKGQKKDPFVKEFEAYIGELTTGKNAKGAQRYGDSKTALQKYKDLGIVTYDKDGNQVVNWDKVTSPEQVEVLKGEVAKDNEFQGRMIAEQRDREKKIVEDARTYAQQNGITLPKGATDAQLMRTVFADKAKKASEAVNKGDAGAAGRMYGSANIVDAANIMHDSVAVARDEAMGKHIEGDDATVMANTEAGKIGSGAMTSMKTAVQKVAEDARDAATNAEGDVADAMIEQRKATMAMNESLRGNQKTGVEGTNVAAARQLKEQEQKVAEAKTAKQKPQEEGQA